MVHYMFRGHGHRYMTDHFHVLHPVYGILFLKQSEMQAPYQLLNNLLNYAFKVYMSLTYILNNILLQISLEWLAFRRVCISGYSWLGMRMLSGHWYPPHTSCPSGYQTMLLRPRYKSDTHSCSVVYCIYICMQILLFLHQSLSNCWFSMQWFYF